MVDAQIPGDVGDRTAGLKDETDSTLAQLIGVLPRGRHRGGGSFLQDASSWFGSLRRTRPGSVLGAWCAKESVRDVYLTDDPAEAALLLDKAIEGCRTDWVDEIQSLGRTLARWRTEIVNHHATGASNGPTEWLNLPVKKVKRAGHGFRCFANYRLRILLHAGGCDWPSTRPAPPGPAPHPNPQSLLGYVESIALERLNSAARDHRVRIKRRSHIRLTEEEFETALELLPTLDESTRR